MCYFDSRFPKTLNLLQTLQRCTIFIICKSCAFVAIRYRDSYFSSVPLLAPTRSLLAEQLLSIIQRPDFVLALKYHLIKDSYRTKSAAHPAERSAQPLMYAFCFPKLRT